MSVSLFATGVPCLGGLRPGSISTPYTLLSVLRGSDKSEV